MVLPCPRKKYKVPLILIYSMVNQPFILDLAPGSSVIESFVKEGFDVYLIDFGVPGYEDKDLTIDDYITGYIQRGVQRILKHTEADEITLIGYCLGGTLTAMYAAIAEEPIKNLIITVTPIDFSEFPVFDKWLEAVKAGEWGVDGLLESIGLIPASCVQAGIRMITSPIYFSHYMSLLNKGDDSSYVQHWQQFNYWTVSHIPFPGAAAKQLMEDLVIGNKLIDGGLQINEKRVELLHIHASLLIISQKYDRLVPENLISPVMNLVSSEDKAYVSLKSGHTGISLKEGLPEYLQNWLHERSIPINLEGEPEREAEVNDL